MVFRPLRSKRSASAFRHRRMVRRERFARSSDGFGDRGFALSYRRIKLVRSPGVAPGSSAWQAESLILTYDRKHQKKNRHLQIDSGRRFFAGGPSSASGDLCP
jgi:hypothetical protein